MKRQDRRLEYERLGVVVSLRTESAGCHAGPRELEDRLRESAHGAVAIADLGCAHIRMRRRDLVDKAEGNSLALPRVGSSAVATSDVKASRVPSPTSEPCVSSLSTACEISSTATRKAAGVMPPIGSGRAFASDMGVRLERRRSRR
ncbi:hypothetical protein GCM10025867_46600 (plasmid) [Frondihabitans sucicola]|uniref:Uncharacterized protein n=1 Tax=Frondihabitans sucicola TaxID=1268041 RepID=A0ABM8GVE6_9MICO|nr:hypothetical protein GCM10025867_46600 [Frondihabitans sucicola]